MRLLHNVYGDKFCSVNEDGVTNYTLQQKELALEQGIKDVIDAINGIFNLHDREMVDYAIYHREKYVSTDPEPSYNEYITLIACHFLIHTEFMPPTVTWHPYVWSPAT
eukprot:m.270967 g.270967  ORF g.270967 m.270967 type:complete len:108 (-) comp40151_c0_seq1:192-515(-)